ncbi:MAG TPA: sigma 54-interacting transcriptional regulator [bacterium]
MPPLTTGSVARSRVQSCERSGLSRLAEKPAIRLNNMEEVFAILERVIRTDGRVMIQGESGTGK